MGTRNLTCVYADGDYKVAQYGQFDGYYEGQGATILGFLTSEGNVEKLKDALPRVRFLDEEGRDKDFFEAYNEAAPQWSSEPDNRSEEQTRWFDTYISRRLGGKILESVANSKDSEILLRSSIDFAGDSLFCEYAYVVDLDKGTFEIFEGLNKCDLDKSERFHGSPTDGEDYKPVKFVHAFDLSNLPTEEEFLSVLREDEEDEE